MTNHILVWFLYSQIPYNLMMHIQGFGASVISNGKPNIRLTKHRLLLISFLIAGQRFSFILWQLLQCNMKLCRYLIRRIRLTVELSSVTCFAGYSSIEESQHLGQREQEMSKLQAKHGTVPVQNKHLWAESPTKVKMPDV